MKPMILYETKNLAVKSQQENKLNITKIRILCVVHRIEQNGMKLVPMKEQPSL